MHPVKPLTFATIALLSLLGLSGCEYSPYSPPPLAFSGDSTMAKQTVVVPTLDTPAPKGKSVIWCGTFQLCWHDIKSIVGPIDVPDSRETAARLDAARFSSNDLPKDGYYSAAGRIDAGIVEKIKSEMAARFPQVTPNLPSAALGELEALAYAYLTAAVKFRTAYFDRERGDEFTDSAGSKTHVSSFGLYKDREASVNATLGRQIEVLYSDKDMYPPREFVLDLDKNSGPSQLILACVEPKESLAATWQHVRRRMQEWKPAEDERRFGEHDQLVVPNINYSIQHSFKELETTRLLQTSQAIDFRLDRSGAALTSQAFIAYAAAGRRFSFTRPFLVVMRKRGATDPYFVMWVDNAELLCKQDAK